MHPQAEVVALWVFLTFAWVCYLTMERGDE